MKTEQIAKLCYEVNRAICDADDDPVGRPSWDVADAEVKAEVREGVLLQFADPEVDFEELAELPLVQRIKGHVFSAIVNTCSTFPLDGEEHPVF